MVEGTASMKVATDGQLSKDEIAQVVQLLDHRRRALEAAGRIDNLEQRMAEIASEEANKVRMAALLQKKRAALAFLARDRTAVRLEALREQGLSPEQAVLALFEGTPQSLRDGRHSIHATRLAFEARYVGEMMDEVVREMPAAPKLVGDPAFAEDIVREMFEIRDGGEPGRSGNPDARKVARIFARYAEVGRRELNRLGAVIGALDGWGGPHAHDAVKMLRVSADEWAQRIAARLDFVRTFPDLTSGEAMDVLKASYETITTGRNNRKAVPAGTVRGPRDLVRMLYEDRVFYFRSADDWLAYQAEFGRGNIWTGMLRHQRKMAGAAAQLEVLGPNPEALLDFLLAPGSEAGEGLRQSVGDASGFMTGVNPDGITAARLLSGDRARRSMARLGGAVTGSVSEAVTQAAKLRYRGRPFFAAYQEQVIALIHSVSRVSGAGERDVAILLGEGMDGLLDGIHAGAFAEDSLPGAMSSAMAKFFRWSALTDAADTMRTVGARMMAAHLGTMTSRSWETLPERLRVGLGRYGIAEQNWRLIQESGFEGPNGNRYVTPDRITNRDVALALRRFISDEIGFGMIVPQSGRLISQPGTCVGALLRSIARLKGSPIAVGQRSIDRSVTLHIGHWLARTLLAGAIAMTAKDYMKGHDRRKFINPDGTANPEALLTAFVQSGGAGIYGDFLFGQINRFASNAPEAGSGAAMELIDNFIEARNGNGQAGDWLNSTLQNTPFANLAFVRPAVDFLILNEIREPVLPGFLKRQRRSLAGDKRQSLLYPQTIGSRK
jgi:hypothetical protein